MFWVNAVWFFTKNQRLYTLLKVENRAETVWEETFCLVRNILLRRFYEECKLEKR